MRRIFRPAPVAVGDAVFAMVDAGAGPPVVLVHGGVSDLRTWERQVAALAGRFRVIAYSRRHAWPNAPLVLGSPDPVGVHVDDLAELIRSRAGGAAHVIGHSLGGLIALLAAIRHPERVRSLVLMEPPAPALFMPLPPRPGPALRLLLSRPRTALVLMAHWRVGISAVRAAFRRGDDRAALALLTRATLGRDYCADLSTPRFGQIWDNRAAERARALFTDEAECHPALAAPELRALRQPLLLLGGEDSPAMHRLVLERLAELVPAARRHTIPVASHIMHENNPAATNAEILAFLDGQTAP